MEKHSEKFLGRWPSTKLPLICTAFIFSACLGVNAYAKLPPPTPEEVAAKTTEAEKQKQQEAKAQAELTRAQDQVAEKYRRDLIARGITPPKPTPVEQTSPANMPQKAVEPSGTAGPHGGTTQSAESHSGNAR